MAIKRDLTKQIKSITRKLIESNFQTDYNDVSDNSNTITWSNAKDISFVLKNMPYQDVYDECVKERAFHIQLIDGALIQFMYKLHGSSIVQHRLAFLPNPNSDKFQDDPEGFEETYFGDELFANIYERKVIVFPIRFDYDSDGDKYVEHDHPYSHMTLGNYKNCRIAVSHPITPNKFINFILRSFYFDKYKEYYTNDSFQCNINLQETISAAEKKNVHIAL